MSSQTPVHRQATRRVPLQFDANGNPMFATVCSPESFPVRALGVPPKRHVIPVIFVPGIMGTNLRATKERDAQQSPAWRPPNGIPAGLKEWGARLKQSVVERQLQLTPKHCEVDPGGAISISGGTYTLTEEEARRRGWGEVHWDSYGKVLQELEIALNDQYEDCGTPHAKAMQVWELAKSLKYPEPTTRASHGPHGDPLPPPKPTETDALKRWNKVKGECSPLTEPEFTKLDDYYYPVWACGYNWLQSNEESAKQLIKRIDEALAWYNRPECHFITEGRVIVVTHSMGGLVARRAAQLAEGKILGVVHGVQPVGGAPAVYRRFRAGTESGGFWDVAGNIAAEILGWDAAAITCVMANASGPMELLPTKHYPPGWLRFEQRDGGTTEALMPPLPVADPYTEIYAKRVQDVWWGMVDETLIDPAQLANNSNITPLESFSRAISAAYGFHDRLKLYFHPETYAHYGSDKKEEAFGAVRWETSDDVPASMRTQLSDLKATDWTGLGRVTLGKGKEVVRLRLANKDSAPDDSNENAGDGTVPRPSGLLAESGCKAVFRMKGFDHQGSYGNRDVLDNVMYCIGKVVQGAKPIKDLPQSKGTSWTEPSSAGSSQPASALSSEGSQ